MSTLERGIPGPVPAPAGHHPLDLFPFFQRFRPGAWRDVLYTFIWNTGFGSVLWLVAVMFSPQPVGFVHLAWNVLVANCIGYAIHLVFLLGDALGIDKLADRGGRLATLAYYTVSSTLGVVLGFGVLAWGGDERLGAWLTQSRTLMSIAASSLLISGVLVIAFLARARRAVAEAELERARARAERIEREAALANLRALQAQIEPHFLFNTLANVSSLIDADPALAKRMVESFNRFLRASLAATRDETTTLGEEGLLIAAYLDVLQVRMGQRLRYAVDVPPELAGTRIAPMLLQPVVENGIRHGLEPKVEGGEIRFGVRREAGSVVVEVADTGVGFAPTTRGGVGLTNLRDRLALLYGPGASLAIVENAPAGTLVRITLPS